MRSRKLSPGLAVTRTTIRSESTRVPPVTALRSPPDFANHRRRFAGDRRLVDRRRAFEHLAVGGHELAGLDDEAVALAQAAAGHALFAFRRHAEARVRIRFRAAQGLGLRLSAALGHGLGEVREQHGEPQPRGDREVEAGVRPVTDEVAHQKDRRRQRADLDDEHDGIARLPARIELLERIADGARDDRAVEERARLGTAFQTPLTNIRTSFLVARAGARRSGRARRPAGTSARRR